MRDITAIGFDADDTLWQNEQFFKLTEARFQALLADWTAFVARCERGFACRKPRLRAYEFGTLCFDRGEFYRRRIARHHHDAA